ncbi:WW domain-containing oxidoreductase [Apiospora arundinis]|uniref:WW domain-containing oxidoreductase n=1 Tax=Apiospora arundinis TaxID=335852 RepID=A0ABR2JHQ3_9PEZI
MSPVSQDSFPLTGRYAERNRSENLAGPGDSRPTGLQVIEDEGLLDGSWGADKVCLVTGVSAGIGPETVRALAATGATVYGTARDLDKARAALGQELLATGRVHVLLMDQVDLASVRSCAAEFRKHSNRLNVMVNNAAVRNSFLPLAPLAPIFYFSKIRSFLFNPRICLPITILESMKTNGRGIQVMNTPQSYTKDGFELQFGTNHLSHFLLFHELRDLLLASSTPDFHSRVVNVSSAAHKYSPLDLDDVNFTASPSTRPYDGWAAYGASKTANIYMTTQIERLFGGGHGSSGENGQQHEKKIHGYAVHPGSFVSPNLQKHSAAEMAAAHADPRFRKIFADVQQGCATSVYAAVSAALEGRGGLYLEGCSEAGPSPSGDGMENAVDYGHGNWAFDEALEKRLWERSLEWVGAAADHDVTSGTHQ